MPVKTIIALICMGGFGALSFAFSYHLGAFDDMMACMIGMLASMCISAACFIEECCSLPDIKATDTYKRKRK